MLIDRQQDRSMQAAESCTVTFDLALWSCLQHHGGVIHGDDLRPDGDVGAAAHPHRQQPAGADRAAGGAILNATMQQWCPFICTVTRRMQKQLSSHRLPLLLWLLCGRIWTPYATSQAAMGW